MKGVAPPIPPRTYRDRWIVVNRSLRPRVPPRPMRAEAFEDLVHVSIPGTGIKIDIHDKAQKPFATYYIQTECRNGCGWTVQRRFRELHKFAQRIRQMKLSGMPGNLKFPSRFSRKSSLSSVLIEQRRKNIEAFLRACVQCVAFHDPGGTWRLVGEALSDLLLVRQNYCLRPCERKSRIPYGSFQVKSTPSGLLVDADARTLRAQALVRHALARHPRTVQLPSEQAERRRKLSANMKNLAGNDPTERLCLELGRLVAMQQAQVDRFAAKMLHTYPPRSLARAGASSGAQQVLPNRPSVRGFFRWSRDSDGQSSNSASAGSPSSPPRTPSSSSSLLSAASSVSMAIVAGNPAGPTLPGKGNEVLHRVHRYLTQISWKLVEANPDMVDLSKTAGFGAEFCFDMTHRLFEAALLERHADLADRLFLAAASCDEVAEADMAVQARLDELQSTYRGRGIPPALFGAKVHPQFSLDPKARASASQQGFAWGWEEAVEIVDRLMEKNLPTAQVEVLMECVSELHRGIASAETQEDTPSAIDAAGQGSPGSNVDVETKSEDSASAKVSTSSKHKSRAAPKALGADDFVPVLFYVLACSKLRQPWALHKYMSSLASDSIMETEAKYWLTVLESGLHFLTTADF